MWSIYKSDQLVSIIGNTLLVDIGTDDVSSLLVTSCINPFQFGLGFNEVWNIPAACHK